MFLPEALNTSSKSSKQKTWTGRGGAKTGAVRAAASALPVESLREI